MIDINALNDAIKEKGVSVRDLAKQLYMDPATLYRKFKNPDNLTIKEVNSIVKILGLSFNQAKSIFFSEIVA